MPSGTCLELQSCSVEVGRVLDLVDHSVSSKLSEGP